MRIRRNYIRLLLSIIIVTTHSLSAFAGGGSTNYYYAKATATAIPTGAGTVYAENPDNAEGSGTIGAISTAKGVSTQSRGSVIFRFNAYPAENYDFKGWSSTNIVNATPTATDNPYNTSYNASNNDGENNASQNNIYAIFVEKPLFYFSASAVATPEGGGTTSVSPATTNARGEHWNSTSATSTAIAFSATANTGSVFIGWSTTAEGSIVSTDNPYNPTLTSTSTTSGSPTNTTYYARFSTLADPTGINATNITVAQGTTITASNYTLTTAEGNTPYKHVTAESADNSIATVASSGNGFTITGVGIGSTTITITAYKQDNTEACTTTFTVTVTPPESGVSGGVVTLNDLEDHSWSYYSDPDCPIRSLNPADVKITYYGDGIMMTGNNDYTASSTDFVKPGQTNYTGGAKVNVGGEDENTFIYYKTLERTDGSTSANPTGRCAYTTIPNPFQVRPTYGTPPTSNRADWPGWRGFQCWRLKSFTGGAVYNAGGTALSVGAIIDAETEIYFAPNSEYGMEVELEAVWSIAYIVYATGNGAWSVPNHADLGYERNFVVLSSDKDFYFRVGNGNNTAYISNINRPSTITPYLPNGTSGNKQIGRVRGEYANNASNSNITLQANTKFENVQFTYMGERYLTAEGHSLIIGRGCSGTVNTIKGSAEGYNQTYSNAYNFSIRLESGNYTNLYLLHPAYTDNYNIYYTTYNSTVNVKCTLGCDYDRATNKNSNLSIAPTTGNIYGAEGASFTSQNNKDNLTFDWIVKSGIMHGNRLSDANADESIYIGAATARYYIGKRRIVVEGGVLSSISGSLNSPDNESYDNNYTTQTEKDVVTIRVKGGTIRGSIYGAAAFAGAAGGRTIITTGGTVNGWIAGGCNGTRNTGGELFGSTYLYIGGGTKVVQSASDPYIGGTSSYGTNGAYGGNIFGAGCGIQPNGYNANNPGATLSNLTVGKVFGSSVVVADEAEVGRDVYGGGNFGLVADNTFGNNNNRKADLYILGGTIRGNVYGGSNNQNGQTVNITMKGGTIEGGLYGGSNSWGTINDNVTMQIDGGQVGTSSTPANIHGGGYGQNTAVKGNVDLTLGAKIDNGNGTFTYTGDVKVYGDVYGGSADGSVNDATSDHTYVTLNAGTINGSLYGGGLGITNTNCNVNGAVQVVVNGGKVIDPDGVNGNPGSIFGCNNAMGSPKSTVSVTVNGTDAHVPATYYQEGETLPDGKKVGDEKTPAVYAINGVYGGGNEADYTYTPANNTNSPIVIINGCESSIKDVYGGGNAAAVPQTYVTINGGKIGRVFGGGNGERGENYPAHVGRYTATSTAYGTGNTNVLIKGGTIGQVFGGSNSNGEIKGNIKVDVETNNVCDMAVGEVYGGGNKAPSNVGLVTIGCMGDNDIIDYVYGGSNEADITGNVNLTIKGGRINNVFGGNNTGHSISGSIAVTVDWSQGSCSNNYLGNVFGGGNLASIGTEQSPKAPTVNINHGTVTYNVYGGGKGASAVVTGNPVVTIGDTNADHCAIVGGDVYGGGDAAAVTGNTSVTYNDNNASSTVGNLFGGGNAAGVSGTSTVTLTSGKVTNGVYGGCNAEGSVGVVTIVLNGGQVGTDASHTADVYGGGLGANTTTTGNIDVNLNGTTVYGDLYGGSALGSVNADGASPANLTTLTISSNSLHGTIYGGGKGSNEGSGTTATSNGNVQIDYNTGNTSLTGLYGGANVNGLVKGDITVNVLANVGATGNKVNVFGGGLGQNTNTNGNVTVNVGTSDGTKAPVIYGDVYGGSALGNVNSGTEDYTHVNLNAGTIYGDAYGGGLGDANNAALVNGNVKVTQNGVAFVRATTTDNESNTVVTAGRIFGCNNLNGSPKGTVLVEVNATTPVGGGAHAKTVYDTNGNITTNNYDMAAVYGGGNLAAYEPTTPTAAGQYTINHTATGKPVQVVINGCTAVSIEYVYGGGNAAATPATDVVVLGAFELGNVFGGGNGKDKISYDGTTWTANPGADVGYKTGGAEYGSGESTVTITGGTIHKAFGGSNTLGNVRTSATVNLDEAGSCPLEIDEVYGGGNEAYMAGGGNIILGCITYLKEIYGGARNADVGSNVSLTITSGHFDRVFGGNNQGGKIKGSITVNIEETGCHPITIGELYGCGNAAAYSVNDKDGGPAADPVINIKSFTSIGRVFGGGLGTGAVVTGNPTVNINEIVGAGANNMDWTYHQTTKTEGGETLPDAGKAITLSDGSSVTMPTHSSGKIGAIGTVFGGGNAAKVIGNTNVNIGTLSTITYVSGSDHADKTVVGVDIRGNVYGGGNQADVTGNTNVVVGK